MDDCKECEATECDVMMGKEKPDPKFISKRPLTSIQRNKADPEIILKRPLTSFQRNKAERILNVQCVLNVVLIVLIIGLSAALIIFWTRSSSRDLLTMPYGFNTCPPETIDNINEKSAPCEDYWIWYRGKCYYFSTERDTWRNSEKFCHSHNSSLAIIDNKEELDFLFRYKGKDNHWIGLRRTDDDTGWTWTNGTLYNENLFNIRRSSPENIESVYLNSEHVGSDRGHFDFRWICSKN